MLSQLVPEGAPVPKEVSFPVPKLPREKQQDPYVRQMELDPAKYTPKDVQRELVTTMPPITIDLEAMKKMQQQKHEGDA